MKMAFEKVLQPLDLGFVTLANRFVMGSMHTGLEDGWRTAKRLAAFYRLRAEGGVGLIITGGVSPDFRGRLSPFASQLSHRWALPRHRTLTQAVHAAGGRICLQLLHAGRYAMHPFCVAPSALRSPISPFTPRAMSARQIQRCVRAFARAAALAREAGYDGVEVMGSEGYLINQFSCRHANRREDDWGGDIEGRMRFSLEVVRAIREAVGEDWLLIYRQSVLDLLPEGNRWDEVVTQARAIGQAGANLINCGIGWHEVCIPTIASMTPPAAFTWVSKRLRQAVDLPVIACNRINRPELAEQCLQNGEADLVSMARPFLADPALVAKTRAGRVSAINTCIGCNQSCLDRVFQGKPASCLVNPLAGCETRYPEAFAKTGRPLDLVVVGLGVAGLSFALTAARRGHRVTAYDAGEGGGQFRLAAKVPGKADYQYSIDYFLQQCRAQGVRLHLHQRMDATALRRIADNTACDAIVLATGVRPRRPAIDGIDHPRVMNYEQAILRAGEAPGDDAAVPGRRVAIIGSGGIGFDVAEALVHGHQPHDWYDSWGIDRQYRTAGGVQPTLPVFEPARKVFMLQRKAGKPGRHLGKTTGWVHRLQLRRAGVEWLGGVQYRRIDDAGLHIEQDGRGRCLAVDHIVVCAGQEEENRLADGLRAEGHVVYCIGGARQAGELDAERAIREGMELALCIEKRVSP